MNDEPTRQIEPALPARVPKRLYRPRDKRMFLGVCAGLAHYFDSDPALMRSLFAITLLLGGVGLVVYLVLALVMPNEEMLEADPRAAAQATIDEAADEIRRGINRSVDAVRGALGKDKRGA